MERIVVGVDGSQPAREALRWAIDEARRRDATVEAVYAWHQPFAAGFAMEREIDLGHYEDDAQKVLDDAVDAMTECADVAIERKLVAGSAAGALVDEAKGASLLVVGSRGRGGFAGLMLGSVSQQAAHHAPCPVVIIPSAA
jgi:nucleotide-binding universal stress UspA family protein